MSTEVAPKSAPITGYTTDERFYATRYKQGGRTVFLVALTPDQIINNILRPNPESPNPGNRRIRLPHAQSFAKYYLEHDNWVIPGIILRAPAIFEFDSDIDVEDHSAQFGVLSYPRRKQGDIQILDGQHRILGFHLALEMLESERLKALDHLNRARKVEQKGSRLIKDAEAKVKEITEKQDRFYIERVSVEIQVTDDINAYRQMFFDIADNALGISASVKARFDKRKVVNRAFALVAEHPLMLNRVDPENDRLGRTGPYLFSAKHVTEIIRCVIVGLDGRVGRVMEKEISEVEVASRTGAFLDLLMRAFPQLAAVEQGSLLPDRLRQTSMLGSPLFVRILAGVYHELLDNHAWTPQMVEDYFSTLGQHLAVPLHANTIWLKHTPEDTFNLGGYGPNGRRQDVVNTYNSILSWALDHADFVYAAPEAAPVPEVDPDEGVDFAYDFDTKAVDVAERNAIEEIAAESKKRAPKKSQG